MPKGLTPAPDNQKMIPTYAVDPTTGVPTSPTGANSSGNLSRATSASSGASFQAFTSQACHSCWLANNTGVDIDWRKDGGGVSKIIYGFPPIFIDGLTNMSQLEVRRTDVSTVSVLVNSFWRNSV